MNLQTESSVASTGDNRISLTEAAYRTGLGRKNTLVENLLCVINALGTLIYSPSLISISLCFTS